MNPNVSREMTVFFKHKPWCTPLDLSILPEFNGIVHTFELQQKEKKCSIIHPVNADIAIYTDR